MIDEGTTLLNMTATDNNLSPSCLANKRTLMRNNVPIAQISNSCQCLFDENTDRRLEVVVISAMNSTATDEKSATEVRTSEDPICDTNSIPIF